AALFAAWLPYLLLVAFVLAWGDATIKPKINRVGDAFIPASLPTVPATPRHAVRPGVPGRHTQLQRGPPVAKQPAPYAALYELNWLPASGTSCFLATMVA